jgi:hypothetical protein
MSGHKLIKKLIHAGAWVICLLSVMVIAWTGFRVIETWYKPFFRPYLEYSLTPLTPVKTFISGAPLIKGNEIRLVIHPNSRNLGGIRVRCVTWGDRQKEYLCNWSLNGLDPQGKRLRISRSGIFSSANLKDWDFITLTFEPIRFSESMTFELLMSSEKNLDSCFIGVPVYDCDSLCDKVFSFVGTSTPKLQTNGIYMLQFRLMYKTMHGE